MSIIAVNTARAFIGSCSPDHLYLLQHDAHVDSVLKAAGVNPADLTDDERASILRYARSLWADHGTYDESKG